MNHLRGLGDSLSISIEPDEDGFTGRECPNPDCEGYFKIEFGTGLKGQGLPCRCPYCGHTAPHDGFWTREQIEYAKSIALRKITDAFHKDLKKLEFEHKPRGVFGVGISLKVKRGRPTPIHYYREKTLETEVVCDNCTLRYSVYGVFAFCPDCGLHNSLQILNKNLEVVEKILDLATGTDQELAERLVENALEDCVSAFDGFGRELCRMHAQKSATPARVEKINFQNLDGAKSKVLSAFGIDLLAFRGQLQYPGPETGDWELDSDVISDILYELRDREVLLILAPVEGEPVHLCGICGFVLSGPGEPCPRCALINEDVAAAIDAKRVANSAAEWLKEQREPTPPHPLEVELDKIQNVLDALEKCPPLWWADKLLWKGLRWFYTMRQRRVQEAFDELTCGGD